MSSSNEGGLREAINHGLDTEFDGDVIEPLNDAAEEHLGMGELTLHFGFLATKPLFVI